MKLADILKSKGPQVHSVRPEETVRAAAQRLVQHNIGSLPVLDATGCLLGIITERDILRLSAQGTDLAQALVRDHMTIGLVTATSAALVDDALAIMTQQRVRHLPVVNEGRLEGLVSLGDLVKAKLDEAQHEVQQLTNFVLGKYPA